MLSYKRSGVIVIIVVLVAVATALVAFASNPQAKFNIDTTQAQAMRFSTAHTDLVKIGEVGVINYYSAFTGKNIPTDYRVADYTITDIQHLAGDIDESCVMVTANYFTTGMFFFSANGAFRPVDGGYNCEVMLSNFALDLWAQASTKLPALGLAALTQGSSLSARMILPTPQRGA